MRRLKPSLPQPRSSRPGSHANLYCQSTRQTQQPLLLLTGTYQANSCRGALHTCCRHLPSVLRPNSATLLQLQRTRQEIKTQTMRSWRPAICMRATPCRAYLLTISAALRGSSSKA